MAVYFAKREDGLVKIGTSGNVKHRIMALSSKHKMSFDLLRKIGGGIEVERWVHEQFAPLRLFGEFFTFHPNMMSIIPPNWVIDAESDVRDARIPVNMTLDEKREIEAAAKRLSMPAATWMRMLALAAARRVE